MRFATSISAFAASNTAKKPEAEIQKFDGIK